MVKKIDVGYLLSPTIGTSLKWYKDDDQELLNNTGKTPIRVDKILTQFSGYHSGTDAMVMGAVVHMSDETGATFTDAITDGSTDDAALEVIMNQWKDLIWMTDFEILGTGKDETTVHVSNLEANTRRLLNPGQALYFTLLTMPIATETSKAMAGYLDNLIWYSPAAQ